MDSFLIGAQRTSSNSSFITDSAAAGTALATGHKTINGQISVDVNKKPVGAIGEALKLLVTPLDLLSLLQLVMLLHVFGSVTLNQDPTKILLLNKWLVKLTQWVQSLI